MRTGWRPYHNPPVVLYRALSRQAGIPWYSFLPRKHNFRWSLKYQETNRNPMRYTKWRYPLR